LLPTEFCTSKSAVVVRQLVSTFLAGGLGDVERWGANFDLHDSESCQVTHKSRSALITVVGSWYLRGYTRTESWNSRPNAIFQIRDKRRGKYKE